MLKHFRKMLPGIWAALLPFLVPGLILAVPRTLYTVLPDGILLPGSSVLTKLGFVIDAPAEMATALLIAAWVWINAGRLVFIAGRPFGLSNPDHYGLFTLWFPWRPVYARIWRRLVRWHAEVFQYGKRATGAWPPILSVLTLLYRRGGLLLGRPWMFGLPGFQPIGLKDFDKHICMIAPPGGGKTNHLITILALQARAGANAFITDVDGQISNAIGPGIDGFKALDTNGQTRGVALASWNVIEEADVFAARHGPDSVVRFFRKVADALIIVHPRTEPIWPGASKKFLLSLFLWVYKHERRENRNLARLYELLCNGDQNVPPEMASKGFTPMKWLLFQMSEDTESFGGVISFGANALADAPEKTRESILITMREALQFVELPELRRISAHSNFTLEDLKLGKLKLSICAPAMDIQGVLAPYFRLFVICALYTFENLGAIQVKRPCLFAIDEAPSLGHIEALATAAPLFRKYQVRLIIVSQTVQLLKKAYPDDWRTIMGSSEAIIWMNCSDEQTLGELIGILGSYTRKERLDGGLLSKGPGRHHFMDRPVLTPDQARRFLNPQWRNLIVTMANGKHMRLKAVPYFRELPVWMYEKDPKYPEQPLRALTRAVLRFLAGLFGSSASSPALADDAPALEAPQTPAQPLSVTPPSRATQDLQPV